MKIIRKKYWQGMKNFVEQISIKFGGFYSIKMNLYKLCCRHVTKILVEIHISTDIQKVKYRPIMSVGRYIGWSLKCIRFSLKTSKLSKF